MRSSSVMKISRFTVNPFSENTYILWEEGMNDIAVVDPGMCTTQECETLYKFFEENNFSLKMVLLTHQHVDHIMGTGCLVEKYGCQVYGHAGDIELGSKADVQMRMFNLPYKVKPFCITDKVVGGDVIKLNGESIKVLHTPGHSAGGVVFFLPESGCAFVGDTIFQMSIGRTDLTGGDYDTLIESIRTEIYTLPKDTILYPGHGGTTTVGDEKQYNPFVKECI